jgi:hypothetical protein
MKYQTFTVLPWWFKRWVLMDKSATCPPLYTFDGHVDNDEEFVQQIRRESRASGTGGRKLSIANIVNKM